MAYVLVVTSPAPESIETRHRILHGPQVARQVAEILRLADPELTRSQRLGMGEQVMLNGQKRTLVHTATGHRFRIELADVVGLTLLAHIPAQV
jgi:hypothetical protein